MIENLIEANEKVFIYGAGGHSKVVVDILRLCDADIRAVIDDDKSKVGKDHLGVPVLYAPEAIETFQDQGIYSCIIGIGANRTRMQKAEWVQEKGFRLISAVHPKSSIAQNVTVGAGTVIMAGVVVNPGTRIGTNVILNTRCSVDHDNQIGDAVHISPGACLGGCITVGDYTQIGIGATILPNLKIGSHSIVGGGAVVIRDIPDDVTVIGMPADILKINIHNEP